MRLNEITHTELPAKETDITVITIKVNLRGKLESVTTRRETEPDTFLQCISYNVWIELYVEAVAGDWVRQNMQDEDGWTEWEAAHAQG